MTDDLSALLSRAQKALEVVNSLQKEADEALGSATQTLKQTHSFHAALMQVQILLKEHFKV